MQIRTLGHSGLKVSRLCLGTMMFGDRTDEAEARRILDHARESGVDFLDTADMYAAGRSEEIGRPADRAGQGCLGARDEGRQSGSRGRPVRRSQPRLADARDRRQA